MAAGHVHGVSAAAPKLRMRQRGYSRACRELKVEIVLIVVSRGWGAWVIPIIIGTTAVIFMLCKAVMAVLGIQSSLLMGFSLPFALSVAAIGNWCLGRHLNGKLPELVDVGTGERALLQPRHDMYTVRMEYWSIPVAIFAVFKFVMAVLSAG